MVIYFTEVMFLSFTSMVVYLQFPLRSVRRQTIRNRYSSGFCSDLIYTECHGQLGVKRRSLSTAVHTFSKLREFMCLI